MPLAITLPELPDTLRTCGRPVNIAEATAGRDTVSEADLADLWARDRATAVQCRNRLTETSGFYDAVRDQLRDRTTP